MANYHGNPSIAEYGKNTRFGAIYGRAPSFAGSHSKIAAYSIRAALKHIAAQPIDIDDFDNEIKRLLKHNGGKASAATVVAVRMYERVIKKMEVSLVTSIIENIEGKLTKEICMPAYRKAPTDLPTMEEAEAAYKEFMGQ